eukprot:Platyproteum_vivax@DN4744_c0_g1_i2.p1
MLVQPSAHSDTEIWTHDDEFGSIKQSFRKQSLALDDKCIQKITLSCKNLYLLSRTGVVWEWDYNGSEHIQKLEVLEPVYKQEDEYLLTITGSIYYCGDGYLPIKKFECPIKFTDIIRSGGWINFTDKNGKFYKCVAYYDRFDHFQEIEIDRFLAPGFVWKDWNVSYSHFRTTDILTLISHNMTVWQWDLTSREPIEIEEEQVLQPITNLRPQNSSQKINSFIYGSLGFLLYLAENGTLYS